MKIITLAFTLLSLTACDKRQTNMETPNNVTTPPATDTLRSGLTYLALGDSYTIGEAVEADKNFPNQLITRMPQYGLQFNKPQIIARTGWTTDELIQAIDQQKPTGTFNLVTLLIGVNNQYRGYNIDTYRTEFKKLLNTALNYAGNNKAHVFVLSIPDYSVTPFAQNSDREKIAREIDQYNAINKAETENMGIAYIDITPISRQATAKPELIANDGLHPSALMYKAWIDLFAGTVATLYK
ncbi:SGNH/GDSL hydrolase family protein [Mucilaginibacter sp. UR6-1]|uniref:SGNH/GDSL hydrolase family protein n=1 Tax=Mucilaginibacter sp. UR6-1 TaxID=1435643 RepID=UPI001E60214A|nr:SGNH/GDSL hydrolase family protein [Mucilaginibacter sp. UR6-1]MCC8409514.1 SGNH/GDSL hydrolase family protein [Mucilaginibacter sp. UR6-1]